MNVSARLDHASPAAGVVAGVVAASVACAARIGAAAWKRLGNPHQNHQKWRFDIGKIR